MLRMSRICDIRDMCCSILCRCQGDLQRQMSGASAIERIPCCEMSCRSFCHSNSFHFWTFKSFKLFTVGRVLELQYVHTQDEDEFCTNCVLCFPKSWVVHVHFLSLRRLGLEPQWIKDKKPLSRDWRVAAARAVEDALSANMSRTHFNMSPLRSQISDRNHIGFGVRIEPSDRESRPLKINAIEATVSV